MKKHYTYVVILPFLAFLLAIPLYLFGNPSSSLRSYRVQPGVSGNGAICSTYTPKTTINGLGSNVVNDVVAVGNTVYVATNGGLSISTDGGNSFINKTTANGLGSNSVDKLVVVGDTIYAATGRSLSISTDVGNSFISKPYIDESFPNPEIIGLGIIGNSIYIANTFGLSVTYDGGDTYQTLLDTSGLLSYFMLDLYIDGTTIYLATARGLRRSTDGGDSFRNLSTDNGVFANCGGSGLYDNYVYDVYAIGDTIYSATCDGLNISTDGGKSFANKNIANGLPSTTVYRVFALGSTVYVFTPGVLSVSANGGDSFSSNFTTLTNGLRNVFATESLTYIATEQGLYRCSTSPTSDLTPVLYARPSTTYSTELISVVVEVYELNGVASSSQIMIKLNKDPKVSLSFSSEATSIGGISVQNSVWNFDSDSDEDYYVLTSTQAIASGDVLAFGLTGSLTPGATSGSLTFTGVLGPGSGGEVLITNNSDADKIDFFQQ